MSDGFKNGVLNTALTGILIGHGTGNNCTASTAIFNKVVTQVFTGNGTYTPTSGMVYCIIESLGGGGAGGGAAATGAGTTSSSGGGGGGEYALGVFTASDIGASKSVTIGAAGTGSSGTTGGNGGNTSVGSTLISANGGSGGTSVAATANYNSSLGGAGGTGGTGGSFRTAGYAGGWGQALVAPGILMGGSGANSIYGSGGISKNTNGAGNAAAGYGAGGGGGPNYTSQSAVAGGNGTAGLVVVTEFCYS